MKLFVVFAFCVSATLAVPLGQSKPITRGDLYTKTPISSENRIIGGQPATVGQFPWQVAVYYTLSNGNTYLCGGALISNEWVLTAAQCASGVSSFRLLLGATTLDGSEEGTVTDTTTTATAHPGYNSNSVTNDIAVIRLSSPVTFTDRIQPVNLPSFGAFVGPDESVTVSGWGTVSDGSNSASNVLNYVGLTTISNVACQAVYGGATVQFSTLCAVGNPEHSICYGDSGGVLVAYDNNNVATAVGVASFVSNDGCASGDPSGYTRVASFLGWISAQTGIRV